MYKSIDCYLIGYNKDTDVVTVAAQVFLVRTNNPEEAVVAYDVKRLKYIADFDGHDLGIIGVTLCMLLNVRILLIFSKSI